MRHDIPADLTVGNLRFQEYIHRELDKAYTEKGETYGGRLLYGDLSAVQDKEFGWNGRYLPMNPDINREVIGRIMNQIYEETNTVLLDKFEITVGNETEWKAMIKATSELIADINKIKNWQGQVQKLVDDASKRIGGYKRKYADEQVLRMDQLVDIGKAILGRSTELCPIETGQLRDSGKLYVMNNFIKIIYECPYAVYVHENVNCKHAFGQAKFLETACQEILGNISVWTEAENNIVSGTFYKQVWQHDSHGRYFGTPEWKSFGAYQTVYITIDQMLRVNYAH